MIDSREWPEILEANRARIFERIEQYSALTDGGCIEWRGAKTVGYGVVSIKTSKGWRALRVTRLLLAMRGLLNLADDSVLACHSCDNPACINVSHLFVGTQADNMKDCSRKGRVRVPGLSGSDAPRAKLSPSQVKEIRLSCGSSRQVARRYGVTKVVVLGIRNGKTYRGVGE